MPTASSLSQALSTSAASWSSRPASPERSGVSIAAGPSSLSRSDAAATSCRRGRCRRTVTVRSTRPTLVDAQRRAGWVKPRARRPRLSRQVPVRRQAPGGTWDRAALPVSRPRRAFRFPRGRLQPLPRRFSAPGRALADAHTAGRFVSESEKPPPLETVRPTTPEPLCLIGSMAISTLPEEFVPAVPRSPARCRGSAGSSSIQARGEPASKSIPLAEKPVRWRIETLSQRVQRGEPCGRVEAGGEPLAPRRRSNPRHVHER